ncbi:MAG: DegT/DnrJ/EryC1/StrS family aminotransferase, partial [Candidatus Pacebacteria bacterium]|nr:DegT/DnrJ/EryC1/StrS family aminotransferase [Candidatus Paceibacterota bacterium]
MIRKIPIVAHPLTLNDLLNGFRKFPKGKLSKKLTEHINAKYIYFASSGSAALYLILKAISEGDSRNEVIIPAYTASSVVYAIEKAG